VILAFVACSVDGLDCRLLPCGRGSDRLADHRQPGSREHRRGRSRRSPASRAVRDPSFGTLLAAFFLSLIDNVLPLFQAPTEYAEMTIGVLILLALLLYQAPELLARFCSSWGAVGRLRAGQGETPSG